MDTYFREAFEAFRQAAQHMIAANEGLQQAAQGLQHAGEKMQLANTAMIRGVNHVLHAKNEHEDLRDTVHRLETTVLDLVAEVRALRPPPETE
jgi:uncharacterized protein YukE